MNRWEVYRNKAGDWRWRLRADNDEVVAQSEAYSTKEHAQEGVQAAMRDAGDAEVVLEDGRAAED